jgi:hypothetical protein
MMSDMAETLTVGHTGHTRVLNAGSSPIFRGSRRIFPIVLTNKILRTRRPSKQGDSRYADELHIMSTPSRGLLLGQDLTLVPVPSRSARPGAKRMTLSCENCQRRKTRVCCVEHIKLRSWFRNI